MIKKKRIIIISIVLILLLLTLSFGISMYLYNQYFGIRYETYEPLAFNLEDFPQLKRNRYEFDSDKGQKLVGYNYYYTDNDIKGVVILSHGFNNGGHRSYLNCADYFAKNGYYVFAFDNTGNDESEGDSVKGLPQGIIDLDYAISFVEEQKEFSNLPIMLFGHSWGGYAVTNVLNYHPEVKAVVSLAGFNKSSDLIKSKGEEYIGDIVDVLMPYIDTYEKLKFKKYVENTSISGFEKTDAKIMIVHSENDDMVDKKYGYDKYYEKYKDSPKFKFILYKDKGHHLIYYSDETIEYKDKFDKEFEKYFGKDEGREEEKDRYIIKNLDRSMFINLMDEELFNEIIELYDSSL